MGGGGGVGVSVTRDQQKGAAGSKRVRRPISLFPLEAPPWLCGEINDAGSSSALRHICQR